MAMLKAFVVAMMVVVVGVMMGTARGESECGSTPVEKAAIVMAPCAEAGRNEASTVSSACCASIKKLVSASTKECLCAVMLSDIAKKTGIVPQVAMSIPKRCNFSNRPVGYKCGAYTLP